MTPVSESPGSTGETIPPHQRAAEDVLAALASDPNAGLTTAEAERRLARHGRNELTSAGPTPSWRRFLWQFQDALVILLLIATAISATLWSLERETALPYEALAILAIVLLNALMGYLQESRAEASVAALRRMSADEATVIRDGGRTTVPAADLVPGDIILIEEGDTIPADARLLSSVALQVSEAALTGESVPVPKGTEPVGGDVGIGDRLNMIHSGTTATYGRGRGVITATGMATEMGRVAGMLRETPDEETPLRRELDRTGRRLGAVVVAIAIVMVMTILLVEEVSGASAVFDVLILGVALAVAAVPEGLPAVVTAVLAVGVQRMARRNAIIRRLAAVETLGSASVIASDKTGTLTRNEMTVRVVATASGRALFGGTGYAPVGDVELTANPDASLEAVRGELVRALAAADRANNAVLEEVDRGAWVLQGDPTEGALIVAARKAGLERGALDERLSRIGEIPFSSERKLMSTVHSDTEQPDRVVLFTKGAPDVLLSRCTREMAGTSPRPLTAERAAAIRHESDEMARDALRTLAVAARSIPRDAFERSEINADLEGELVFLGLIGMIDPPRKEAAQAVRQARSAGIRPLLITGDHPVTATAIARELGISDDDEAISGMDLDRLSDEDLDARIGTISVYARVDPKHKLRIVDALQRRGEIVAMTGDGVNDAPALKSSDIGVAMGITGTDVSKEAADMILTDDNFASIVAAVEEGRAIFDNIRKFLRYLLSSNIGEVMTMFFGVLLADLIGLSAAGEPLVLPLLATQILWINLVTDGAPALALGLDPASPGLMSRPPRAAREGVITGSMWRGIFFVGAVMAAGTLFVLDLSLPGGLVPGSGDTTYGQTMAFTTLVFFQIFNVFNARSDERSGLPEIARNPWLIAAIALSIVLQVSVVHLPFLQAAFGTTALAGGDWLTCVAVASSVLWIREFDKLGLRIIRG